MRFKYLKSLADRDGDELSRQELKTWLDCHEQITHGQVLLTVLDHGQGLFELIDANHDGQLSVRELRGSWDRLNLADCVTDNELDRAKLPRRLTTVVSRGHPR